MTLTSTLNVHSVRFTRLLAAALVAVGATACTVDKNLATASDSDTEAGAATTVAEPTTSTTSDGTSAGDTSSGSSTSTTDPTSTTSPTDTTSPSDDSTTDDSTTGEPVLSCPDHPTIDDCCCFSKDGGDHQGYVKTVCTAEQEVLCEDVVLKCLEGGGGEPIGECVSASDEALVDCALSALMGDKAGSIRVELSAGEGWSEQRIDYHIIGDGSAYRVDDTLVDLSGEYKDTGRYMLQPPDFFMACLAGSIADKADCLREALIGGPQELCVSSFTYDDF